MGSGGRLLRRDPGFSSGRARFKGWLRWWLLGGLSSGCWGVSACLSRARPSSSKGPTSSLLRRDETLSFPAALPPLRAAGCARDSRKRSKIRFNSARRSPRWSAEARLYLWAAQRPPPCSETARPRALGRLPSGAGPAGPRFLPSAQPRPLRTPHRFGGSFSPSLFPEKGDGGW